MKKTQIIVVIITFLISCKSESIRILSKYDSGQIKEQIIGGIDSIPEGYKLKQIFYKDGSLKCQGTVLKN